MNAPVKYPLEEHIKNFMTFIDTCSLIDSHCDLFWDRVVPILRQYNKSIIVTRSVSLELEKHAKNPSKPELAARAKQVIARINSMKKEGLIELVGEANDGDFADNIYLAAFTRLRMEHNLLLITQDSKLCREILALNNSSAVRFTKKIHAKRITSKGWLGDFKKISAAGSAPSPRNGTPAAKAVPFPARETFALATQVTTVPDDQLIITSVPQQGSVVYKPDGTPVTLVKRLGGGGEADVYQTDLHLVAKIYKAGKMTERKRQKIELMLSGSLSFPGICFPVATLTNSAREFVGYLMPEAKGVELAKSVFIPKLLLKHFPHWKKKDTVQLCLTILEKIKYLHDRNIIMGDINPSNILVVSQTEVYFVDTDSYQIEGFPCPVGTVNYTAPEIQKKHFESFLRSFGNENFAVATLLFMIMLPGKPPYSQQGGSDPIANIMNRNFSYPFEHNSNKNTPDGPWRFMWSNLTYNIKRDFYCTFSVNEKYSTEDRRLTVDQWITDLKEYYRLLDTGTLRGQYQELFPTALKKCPNPSQTALQTASAGFRSVPAPAPARHVPVVTPSVTAPARHGLVPLASTTAPVQPAQTPSAGSSATKVPSPKGPIILTVLFAILSFAGLFHHRMDILALVFRKSVSVFSRGNFFYNVVCPMVILSIPWYFANLLFFAVLSCIQVAGPRKHKKHPVLITFALILVLACVGAFTYDHFNPGFIDSIPGFIDQTYRNITAALPAADKQESKEVREAASPVQTWAADAYKVIREDGLTIRNETDIAARQVAKVDCGDIVYPLDDQQISDGTRHWRKVKDSLGNTGWIIADYLAPVTDAPQSRASVSSASGSAQVTAGTARYSNMTFTVEKTGASTGKLTIVSETNQTWKFGPWVGHDGTLTLYLADGSTAHAYVSVSDMFSRYHTAWFDKGHTFTFNLSFDTQADLAWKKVVIGIAGMRGNHDVVITF